MGISLQNDYSFLFGNSSNTTTGNTFSLSDYAMIKNGTYKKLMKAYYADTDNSFVKSVAKSKAASQDNNVEIKKLQETSKALSESAEALYGEKGRDLYTEDKRDDLLKAVSGFVKDYNSTVDAVGSSDNAKVVRIGNSMAGNAVANYKLLSSIGIRVGTDSKLTLDEDTLKKAKLSSIQSVFQALVLLHTERVHPHPISTIMPGTMPQRRAVSMVQADPTVLIYRAVHTIHSSDLCAGLSAKCK